MKAFILITTERDKLWKVAESALGFEGFKMSCAVTGQYDVITFVEFEKVSDLNHIVKNLQSLKGVLRTSISIVMPPRLS